MEIKVRSVVPFIYPTSCFLLNFWVWRIFENNIRIFFLLFALSVSLFLVLRNNSNSISLKIFFVSVLSLVILLVLPQNLDKSIWEKGFLGLTKINTRRSFYPHSVGSIFQNKYVYSIDKYENNLTVLIDTNFYFFASHPRERVGINEYEKFSPIFIPFLLIGLTQLFKNKFFIFSTLTLLLTTAFLDPNYILGPVLILPSFVVTLAIGAEKVFKFFGGYLQNG